MKPAPFGYVRPRSVPEAVAALTDLGVHAKVLAGGQSLVPLLSMRLAAPSALVDVNLIPDLDGIEVTPEAVRVGALTRHASLERSEEAYAAVPLLRQALRNVAHPAIRNRGTTVGSLVHADPAAEMPAVLVLLGGSVEAVSADARRTIPAEQFFAGPMECALRPEELATAASFDRPPAGTRSAFLELSRRHGDYAMCGVAVLVDTAPLGHDPRERMIAGGRAALVGVGAGPVLADLSPAVESGRRFGPDAVRDILDDVIEPEADIHASAEYRRRLAHVLTLRALDEAMSPSGGRQPGTARAPADDDGGPR